MLNSRYWNVVFFLSGFRSWRRNRPDKVLQCVWVSGAEELRLSDPCKKTVPRPFLKAKSASSLLTTIFNRPQRVSTHCRPWLQGYARTGSRLWWRTCVQLTPLTLPGKVPFQNSCVTVSCNFPLGLIKYPSVCKADMVKQLQIRYLIYSDIKQSKAEHSRIN